MKVVKAEDLSDAIQERLDTYNQEVTEKVKESVTRVSKQLLSDIRANAPRDTGSYVKHMALKTIENSPLRKVVAWYVKKPDYRLAHLLEYGHAKVSGGRVAGKPHIHPAEIAAKRQLEQEVAEAVKE